jgi:hypothetical protein
MLSLLKLVLDVIDPVCLEVGGHIIPLEYVIDAG